VPPVPSRARSSGIRSLNKKFRHDGAKINTRPRRFAKPRHEFHGFRLNSTQRYEFVTIRVFVS